jgi:hypothetical protein
MIFGGLGWAWACATSAYLLVASRGTGLLHASLFMGTEADARQLLPSLSTATGVWVTALLACVTLLAGVPLGVALAHPPDHARTAWPAALALFAFSLFAGAPLGTPYLPSAVLLLAATMGGDVELAPCKGRP